MPEPAHPKTKRELLLEMLRRPRGVSISELVEATGWKPNTVHSMFATMRRQGVEIASAAGERGRRYRLG